MSFGRGTLLFGVVDSQYSTKKLLDSFKYRLSSSYPRTTGVRHDRDIELCHFSSESEGQNYRLLPNDME
jgi:hypothetical protein